MTVVPEREDSIACWIFAFALWASMPRMRSFSMRVWLVTIMGLLPFVVCVMLGQD